jgi:purine-nucleoside phosphorylase
MMNKIKETAGFLAQKGFSDPDTGIILGTGLGSFIEHVEIVAELPYEDIPHFPVATVEFHKGRLILAKFGNRKLVIMQGRFHYYEGYSMQEITFPVRVLKMLGIGQLLISNAAGSMNPAFRKGELMLVEDHINMLPDNPLRGPNNEMGDRFPDMSAPYDARMNAILEKVAAEEGIALRKGVYVSVMGPNLETRAEYRFLRLVGADAVGMSTVPEVIACAHMKLPCCAISVLTDDCDPDNLHPVDIADIIKVAGIAEKDLIRLYLGLIREL